MGETQHVYATSDTESSAQDKDIGFEPFSKKDVDETNGRILDSSELCLHSGTKNGTSLKDKEPHNQREAVIRPQQAGKIDFKSLHNRPKFPSDGPWGTVKGSPQSPTGKSRVRDKNRRSGKGERGHQQLYRLTISNARPNPTIGIAYPQQKVTPPKKVEVSRGGPISGSYRFHVPSIPEREVEIQQEDLGFARCFPEAASSHISSNYTSPTVAACPNHGVKVQSPVGIPHESPGTNGQLHYVPFQGNGNNPWPLPDKSLPGANNGLSAPKPCPFPESSKSSAHGLGPLSFQYPFQSSHNSAPDPFQGEVNIQDYVDISVATSQATHGAFAFHPSSRDWKEEVLSNGSYNNMAPESRVYGLVPQQAPFLQSQTQGHLPCYKGRNEHSNDHSGAISSSGAVDSTPGTFQETQAVFPSSLHISSIPKPVGKRQSPPKDNVASQRVLDPGSSLRRNMPQISLPQVHFQNKTYSHSPPNGVSPGSVPFEKNVATAVQGHSRLLQAWEGGKKPYAPLEQSSAPYPSPVGNQHSFGSPLGLESRQHIKKTWHHLHLTSTLPGQNRIELSRKLASQKLPFSLSTSAEWEGGNKPQKSTAYYSGKVLLTGEGAVIQRHDPSPQHCSAASAFCFEGAKDTEAATMCGSRSKSLFFNVSHVVPPASPRLPSNPALVIPPSALAASPCDSPLPSPAPNPTNSSTCSSLSPMSSSPNSHTFEDSMALTTSPFFHHQGHPKDGNKPFHASEPLTASSLQYHITDPIKAFHPTQDVLKEEFFYKGIPVEGHFHKPSGDVSKACLDGFEAELPPPPYSSHHLLASSLSSASLDQLDVFLTCKQCDQNFSNLCSFLEHRQFCSSHVALQGQTKDSSRGIDIRKQLHSPPDSAKHTQTGLESPLPLEPPLQLLALNKTVDFVADGEGKGEAKEDPLKTNPLSALATSSLPLSTSDLEIDDAKLDSLITEALNGLGYQSDNPEIDSSFIDVFADEELASVKVTGAGISYKAKESLASEKKIKHGGMDENMKPVSSYDEHPRGDLAKNRTYGKQHGHKETVESWFPEHGEERFGKQSSMELVRNKAVEPAVYNGTQMDASTQLMVGRKSSVASFLPVKQVTKTISDMKQFKKVTQASSPVSKLGPASEPVAMGSVKHSVKDTTKQKLRSGTWSKELIHKIVQQKNKLHKLHTKSSKVVPLSLLANRLLPETKESKFVEYEYISESDDERVEYAKRHCRRKLGSRFSGRLRNNFSRRRQGRGGGREKEKEPSWSYGQRREREESKVACQEAGRKDDCMARVRRRSSRSSTCSCCQSASLSSETSCSPQSTEKADSDTEKESEQRKRPPENPKHEVSLPRERLSIPEKGTRGRSHNIFSGEQNRASSAKILPAVFKACRRNGPKVSPTGYSNEDEGLLQAEGKPHHSTDMLGKSPVVLFGTEASEQYSGDSSQECEKPRAMSKVLEPCALGMNHGWHQFATYNGEILKYQAEELITPSSVGHHGKCLKRPKEFPALISCFSGNPVDMGIAEKEPDVLVNAVDMFYDGKELSDSYESPGIFSGPSVTEPTSCDNVYLCQGDIPISSYKLKHSGIFPFESDNEQTKVSSPLSFESSSVFGELPITEFDTALYDGVSSSKDHYAALVCTGHQHGKLMSFDQEYPPFLQEKDWIEDMSPVLPEDITQFHNLSAEKPEPLTKRFAGEINQLPLSEKMADYNVPFMNGISDDELEIKRLVTELESQLQNSKLDLETTNESPASQHQPSTERKEMTSQFPPLGLDHENNGKRPFLMEPEFETAALLSTKACICENLVNKGTLLPNGEDKLGSHGGTWPCPFSALQTAMPPSAAADLILVGPSSSKEAQDELHDNLKGTEISAEGNFRETRDVSTGVTVNSCLGDVSNNIAVQSYAEHLIQSPESLFPKTLERTELNRHAALPPRAQAFSELQRTEMLDGTVELESYGHRVPCLKAEFGLQNIGSQETEEDLPPRVPDAKDSEEKPSNEPLERLEIRTPIQRDEDRVALLEKADKMEGAATCQSPASPDKGSDGKMLLFDMLTFSKEVEGDTEYAPAPRGKVANPLEQLQLFVARTVKNNEEDLLLPCFPVLQSAPLLPTCASIQPEQQEEAPGNAQSEDIVGTAVLIERKGSVREELESVALATNPAGAFLEAGKPVEDLCEKVPCAMQQSVLPKYVIEQQQLQHECSEAGDIKTCPEHHNFSPLGNSVATSLPPREQGMQGGQVTGEAEEDEKEATLAFRNHRKSPVSPGSFEKDMPGCASPADLKVHVTCSASLDEQCCENQALRPVKAHQIEPSEKETGQSQEKMPLAPSSPPENRYHLHETDLCSGTSPVLTEGYIMEKQAGNCVETSQARFSAGTGFADQKGMQENSTGNGSPSDFGVPLSEEVHCLAASEECPIPLGVPSYSFNSEKPVVGNSRESPSEHKEWEGRPPFSPVMQGFSATPPLPSDLNGSAQQHLAESTQDVPRQSDSFPCSGNPAASLLETEEPPKLQTNDCKSPSTSSLKQKSLSEWLSQSPGSRTCSLRNGLESLEDISHGLPPSGTLSAQLTDARCNEDWELTQERRGPKEAESCSQERSKVQTQPEAFSKDVDIPEVAAIVLTKTAVGSRDNFRTTQFPEATETRSNNSSQDIDSRDHHIENERPERDENMERSPSCIGQEKNQGGDIRDDSKSGQPKAKKGKGLQVICDTCSVSFKSQIGLMRHRAVKHQKEKDNAPSMGPSFVPLQKALRTSKQASRKNTKVAIPEEVCSAHIAKAAVGQLPSESCRNQRKEPITEIQEVVSRVLNDLSVISLDISHELGSTDCISQVTKMKPENPPSARVGELAPTVRKEPNLRGGGDGEANAKRSDSFAKKKPKKKVKKGKAKWVPNPNKVSKSSELEGEALEACSQVIPSTISLVLTTTVSKGLEKSNGSTSAEEQASMLLPLPLPPPATMKESEEVHETASSTGQQPLQDAGDCGGERADPGLEETSMHKQENWPSVSMGHVEEGLSNICKEAHHDLSVKEPRPQENPLEKDNGQNQKSLLSPNRLQESGDAGIDKADSHQDTSDHTSNGALCPGDSKPCEVGEHQQNQETCDALHSLFDDDTTFSRLFPRSDQFARRKCTRVYGKRAKKPKPLPEVNPEPEGAMHLLTIRMASDLGETSSFCVTRDDPCEYETISIDDALMLNMYHGSKATTSDSSSSSVQNISLQPDARRREEATDLKSGDSLNFLCQKSQTEALPTLSSWSSLDKKMEGMSAADGTPLDSTMEHSAMEASPEPPDLEEESCDTRVNEHPGKPEFHTIDMDLLNAKFDMRDMCFYREDKLGSPDECTLGFKPTPILQGRPSKNKLEEGKSGKTRSDLNLKSKDKQYKCKVCFQWFLTLGELDFHKLTHNPSPPPTCYMCVQRKFSSREQLRDHLKEKHAKNKSGLWACGMCLKEISDVWMYNEHLREHATQFARKGQAQKSVLGLPGCFGEDDTAVSHFLNSIMCRKPSKPARHTESGSKLFVCKDSRSPKETPGQEAKANKDPLESPARIKLPATSPKVPPTPSPDSAPKVEGAQKLAPMHPECKDPSRDCHHCGKQFPKPFKLQRHLVVHSLQKIYLCHRCPMFYQETKELRSHLSQEHRTAGEADIKHTTLYACELCADVMHIIKKSFICSTCNYTFSKKEQYDRHMEKHLVGNSKTFRFRGVLRPGVVSKDGEKQVKEEVQPREGVPAAKKKKVAHHSSLLAQGSPCTHALQLGSEPLLPLSESLSPTAASVTTSPPQALVKTEDFTGDFSSILAEIETSPLDHLPSSSPPLAAQDEPTGPELRHVAVLSTGQLTKSDSLNETLPPFLDAPDTISIDPTSLAHKQTVTQELSPPHPLEKHKQEEDPESKGEDATGRWDGQRLQEDPMTRVPEVSATGFEATECRESPKTRWVSSPNPNETVPQESVSKLNGPDLASHALPLKEKTSSPTLNRSSKENPLKKIMGSQAFAENTANLHSSSGSVEELHKCSSLKDKALPEMGAYSKDNTVGIKEMGSKPIAGHLRGEAAGTQARHTHSDSSKFQERPVPNGLAKFHPKKRKEHKTCHNSASRENIEGDGGKKKRARVPEAPRSESAGGFKGAGWTNKEGLGLSPRRRDAHINKLVPKAKMAAAGGQLKKVVLDQCFQKKAEIRHPNGDLKRKKDMLGKTFHHLLVKDPSSSLPGSLSRHRTVQGAKLHDSHHYRTAESQNNLLNQLFGQKLTSFKIPLRRDTSE